MITNGSRRQQNEKIDKLGIRDYFECILISEEIGISKPAEGIYLKACEHFGCKQEDCFLSAIPGKSISKEVPDAV